MGGFLLLVLASCGCAFGLNRVLAAVELRRACRRLREARSRIAVGVIELVPLSNGDEADRARLDAAPANADLVAAGYVHLGDAREPHGTLHRCFGSPDRKVIVHFSIAMPSDVVAESFTADGVYSTQRGGPGDFARPPTHHHQWLPQVHDARGIIAQHEKWLAQLRAATSASPALLEIRTLEQVIEQAKVQQERIRTWRNSLDDDTLLDLDLRGLLQGAYDTQAARFRPHLVAKAPAARARQTKA